MLYKNLAELRRKKGLSQEKFAEIFEVTRQSVQKWECGQTQPTIDRLLEIANYYNLSVDAILGRQKSDIETIRTVDIPVPDYDALDSFDNYAMQLEIEEMQCRDEGKNTGSLRELAIAIAQLPKDNFRSEFADTFYRLTLSLPDRPDYTYAESSEYGSIDLSCSHSAGLIKYDKSAFHDKLLGSITGRASGCLLGKPLEEVKLRRLIPFLQEIGNYPMKRYIVSKDVDEKYDVHYPTKEDVRKVCADIVDGAPADDDTNYTVLASEVLLKYGRNFTPVQVGHEWLTRQSKFAYFTAERVAYRNMINGYVPPSSAIFKNPYREWIGAQIRADFYGWINPGNPRAAAEMAFRDASVSHVKNGIYGAMFVAAMIAAAAGLSSPEKIIEAGLGEIPSTSRLYHSIKHILSLYYSNCSREQCVSDIHSRYNDESPYHWCHVLPNAEIVTAALLYGKKDFGTSICMAVESGFDTDCNGATVGSIAGMIGGIGGIPHTWSDPIRGIIHTAVYGVETISVTELAERAERFIPIQ